MKLPPVEDERVISMLEVVTSRESAREEVAIVRVVVGAERTIDSAVAKVRGAARAEGAIMQARRANKPSNANRNRDAGGRIECFDGEFMGKDDRDGVFLQDEYRADRSDAAGDHDAEGWRR